MATTTPCTKHLKAALEMINNTVIQVNAIHDHSSHQEKSNSHSNHNLHGEMIMSFHGGFKEVILFDFWETNTLTTFLLSCFSLFILAALYEGLKLAREKLIRHELLKLESSDILKKAIPISSNCNCKHKSDMAINYKTSGEDEVGLNIPINDCCYKNNNNNIPDIKVNSYSSRLFSQGHLIQTLLHMLQIAISFLLMLVFMSYNSWLCLSIVLGAGLGYFVFGLQRITSIDVNEHCH